MEKSLSGATNVSSPNLIMDKSNSYNNKYNSYQQQGLGRGYYSSSYRGRGSAAGRYGPPIRGRGRGSFTWTASSNNNIDNDISINEPKELSKETEVVSE